MSSNPQYLAKVGSKGELFPPSKLRKSLGLSPGTKVLYYIRNGKLIIEPVLDVKAILRNSKDLKQITKEEFNEDRRQLSSEAGN